jgi:hypothetical protein
VGAADRGTVELDEVGVAFDEELLVELPEFVELLVLFPFEAEVRVEVIGMAAVKATVWRFWLRETPVENEVKTVTDALAAADALLLF